MAADGRLRRLAIAGAATAALAGLALGGLAALDRALPPPLAEKLALSAEVVDRDGALLRTFAAADGPAFRRYADRLRGQAILEPFRR
jgi:membrane carboxypeptidase/penicillin-binding protein PbpC